MGRGFSLLNSNIISNSMILIKDKSIVADYIICFAIFIQSALLIMQSVLIALLGIDPEATTLFRVLFTAVPMIVAIFLCFYRRPLLFIGVYFVVISILALHTILFPQNTDYIWTEAPRFLLPVVIPSALCMISVKNTEIVEKVAIFISWVSAVLVFIYVAAFFRGVFIFERYNMSFSYGCLFPMMILYYCKRPFPMMISFLIFLIVVAFGSRGASIVFVGYVIMDLFLSRNRFRWFVLSFGVLAVVLLPLFMNSLESIGITSRTLYLLKEGNLTQSNGRESIYSFFIDQLLNNPISGIGIYGDRIDTGGAYCHNLILELLLNFGFILGSIAVICLLSFIIRTFGLLKGLDRNLYMVFVLYGLGPLMASSSYLKVNYLALLIGFSVLIRKKNKNIHKESSKFLLREETV